MFSWLFFWRNKNANAFWFDFTRFVLNVLYIGVFFRVAFINETVIDYYSSAIEVFVIVFLLYRFRSHSPKISRFDRKIVRYSAYFILFNFILRLIFKNYDFLKQYIPSFVFKYFEIKSNVSFSENKEYII